MSLMNPAGLWLLLGIPVLIVIWLIHPQHERRRVSSSYLWKLSERFMKKRLPVTRLQKWLSFLLQLLLVVGCALLAAQPVWNNGELIDYVVILDSSASMHAVDTTGKTCYERAGEAIRELANETARGHRVSILSAGDEAVWLLQEGTSAAEVNAALDSASCGWGQSDLTEALTLTAIFAEEHANVEVRLYTDIDIAEPEGLTVVKLSAESGNAAVTGLSLGRTESGDWLIEGDITSYGFNASVPVGVRVDGQLKDAISLPLTDGESTAFSFTISAGNEPETVELVMQANDALAADDTLILCRPTSRSCDTLLVTDTPRYLQAALNALNRGRVETVATSAWSGQNGYDLYIFDGYMPGILPTDGMTLLIHPTQLPEGITALGAVETPALVYAAPSADSLSEGLLKDLKLREMSAAVRMAVESSTAWSTVLTCGGQPVLLARETEQGQALAVLLFDLHDSNLPLLTDFLTLLRNAMNTAQPPLLGTTEAMVGETVAYHLTEGETATLTLPDGSAVPMTDGMLFQPRQVGLYTLRDGEERAALYVRIPDSESEPQMMAALTLKLPEDRPEAKNASSPLWPLLAGLLLLLLLTEWMIDCHEHA